MTDKIPLCKHEGNTYAGIPTDVDVDIVVPVYNEQAELGSSIVLLMELLNRPNAKMQGVTWQIVIADNASNDQTWDIAMALPRDYPNAVRAVRIPAKGRGRALKTAWGTSQARVMAYMDVDLSTDTNQIPELIIPILEGSADVAFGSRLLPESHIERCLKRDVISRTYNFMLQHYLHVSFKDAQCGFKAISSDARDALLDSIEDNEWFFDTELLVRAERLGIATREIPVRWREDPGTTVHIIATVRKDLQGMYRLKHEAQANAHAGGGNGGVAGKPAYRGTVTAGE